MGLVRPVKQQLAQWLAPRGLTFNEDKTRVVRLEDGFDFLGFNVRRYRNGKLLTKPSKAAVQRIRSRLAAEVRALHGANAQAVINKLNPVIRGWAAYYRTGVSKEIFSSLDHYAWRLTYRWGLRAHPNKSKRWAVARYFGAFHPSRRDRWVFGDRDTGRYLVKFSWTKIVRHRLVQGRASPDDPALTSYWAERRRRQKPPLGPFVLRLLHAQRGRCPGCGNLLLHADHEPQSPTEWERWLTTVRKAIRRTAPTTQDGSPPDDTARCPHARPLRATENHRPRNGTSTPARPRALRACLSRVPRRVANTALRGPRLSNELGLPDNTASDHVTVLDQAVAQIPDTHRHGTDILIRTDSAGSARAFLTHVRDLLGVGHPYLLLGRIRHHRTGPPRRPSHARSPLAPRPGPERDAA